MTHASPQAIALWGGRIALALVATFAFGWTLKRTGSLVARATAYIEDRVEALEGAGGVQKLGVFSRATALRVLGAFLGVLRWTAILVATYLWLVACAFALDTTRRVADAIVYPLIAALERIGNSLLEFVPNLVFIIAIVVVARLATQVLGLFSRAVEQGRVEFPWLPRELATPTRRIANMFVWLIALIMAFPYLPGSDSRAFQGVSIVIGVLVSLGSTSLTANLFAGLVLTYSRAFHVGDRVKIGDVVGDVIALGVFVTRVRTIKDEEVVIPNAVAQGGTIVNYSQYALETGVQVHTEVTIGYDTAWRTVHRLLVSAAALVDGIRSHPEPYVLQRALDDFYVRYELCAFCDRPNELHLVVARLNQSIQDCFFREGVEICSPHYNNFRDGSAAAVPDEMRGAVVGRQVEPVLRAIPKSSSPDADRRSMRPGALERSRSIRPKA